MRTNGRRRGQRRWRKGTAGSLRSEALVEAAAAPACVLDGQGRVIVANRALELLLGVGASGGLGGRTLASLAYPPDEELARAAVQQVLAEGLDRCQVDARWVRIYSRELVWAAFDLSLVRDRRGRPELAIAMVRDLMLLEDISGPVRPGRGRPAGRGPGGHGRARDRSRRGGGGAGAVRHARAGRRAGPAGAHRPGRRGARPPGRAAPGHRGPGRLPAALPGGHRGGGGRDRVHRQLRSPADLEPWGRAAVRLDGRGGRRQAPDRDHPRAVPGPAHRRHRPGPAQRRLPAGRPGGRAGRAAPRRQRVPDRAVGRVLDRPRGPGLLRGVARHQRAQAGRGRPGRRQPELERANVELETLVYSASHDLKSPMVSLLGYLEYLRLDYGDALGPEGNHYLDRMADSTLYMQQLIHDLIDLSRVGRGGVEPVEVDLGRLVRAIAEDAGAAHPGAELRVGRLPVVTGDPVGFRQLFTNLLDNAVRHGGRPDLLVVVEGRECPDGGVELSVRDNGRGIPAEHRERVFGVFDRLEGPSTSDGTGMGLAICRKIVEVLGGGIGIQGDQGTDVRIVLPSAVAARWPAQALTAGAAR